LGISCRRGDDQGNNEDHHKDERAATVKRIMFSGKQKIPPL
jgi:hypothetical protein